MCFIFKLFVNVCVLFIGFATALDLHLDKCKLEDSACMVRVFQSTIPTFSSGLPEWGIDVLDVLEFDETVQFNMSGFSLRIANGRLKGLKNIIINTVKWETSNNTLFLEYTAPSFTLSGKYVADGRILILPIKGDGDLKLKIKNMNVKILLFLDMTKKSNKTYASIKNYKYDFNVEGGARYNLTNLFNGNRELGDAVLNLMNTNWKDIIHEFGRPPMDSAAKKIFKNVNRFLAKSPLEDISLSFK